MGGFLKIVSTAWLDVAYYYSRGISEFMRKGKGDFSKVVKPVVLFLLLIAFIPGILF
jgi:hypothetical protein